MTAVRTRPNVGARRVRALAAILTGTVLVAAIALAAPGSGQAPSIEAPPPDPIAQPVVDPVRGLAWRRVLVPGLGDGLQEVVAFRDGFVAIGGPMAAGVPPAVLVSPDAEHWTGVDGGVFGVDQPTDLQVAGDRVVLTAIRPEPGPNGPARHLYSSPDGVTWTHWLPVAPGDPVPTLVARVGAGWVGRGPEGAMSSSDGDAWTLDRGMREGEGPGQLVAGPAGPVLLASAWDDEADSWQTTVLRAPVAGAWNRLLMEGGGGTLVQALAAGPERYAAGGVAEYRGSMPDPREWGFENLDRVMEPTLWWSADGVSWVRGTGLRTITGSDGGFRLVAFGRGFLAFLPDTGAAWWSPDGTSWDPLSLFPDDAMANRSLIADGGRLLLFGWTGDDGPVLWIGHPR